MPPNTYDARSIDPSISRTARGEGSNNQHLTAPCYLVVFTQFFYKQVPNYDVDADDDADDDDDDVGR